jgi:hypothetical protein
LQTFLYFFHFLFFYDESRGRVKLKITLNDGTVFEGESSELLPVFRALLKDVVEVPEPALNVIRGEPQSVVLHPRDLVVPKKPVVLPRQEFKDFGKVDFSKRVNRSKREWWRLFGLMHEEVLKGVPRGIAMKRVLGYQNGIIGKRFDRWAKGRGYLRSKVGFAGNRKRMKLASRLMRENPGLTWSDALKRSTKLWREEA